MPDINVQKERLEIIRRLEKQANFLELTDPERHKSLSNFLTINEIETSELPAAIRRTYLGVETEPGYLMFVYDDVNMNDNDQAKLFYTDVGKIEVNEKTYYSASESFIFIEMIALMKSDAIKAISLVIFVTFILILAMTRKLLATCFILLPPLLGVLLTIAFMLSLIHI